MERGIFLWEDKLEPEVKNRILDLIIETYNVGFSNNNGVIKDYLKPAGVEYAITTKYKYSDNIVKDVINELPNSLKKDEIIRSLFYRLLYIDKGDGAKHYITKEGMKKLKELVQLTQNHHIEPIYLNEIVQMNALSLEEFRDCLNTSFHLVEHVNDRDNLHQRDIYERFNNILMGEIAELLVIKWLHQNGKFAESAVDKTSKQPDLGHDINLKDKEGNIVKCSVKSSLAVFRNPREILLESKLASTQKEIRQINIQVYYWYKLYSQINSTGRVTLPNTNNVALFSWAGNRDISNFKEYATEEREASGIPLCELRRMDELLNYLQ